MLCLMQSCKLHSKPTLQADKGQLALQLPKGKPCLELGSQASRCPRASTGHPSSCPSARASQPSSCPWVKWMSQSGCRHLCVGTCRHVERCRHLCRHLDVPTRADTCWHMNVIWKLGCADMCQHVEGADTWEGADTCWHLYVPTRADTFRCRHVPTPVISVIWILLGYWDVLANASTWKGADT